MATIDDANLREQFRCDGYVILPDVVPSDRLESLRTTVDEIVDRERQRNSDWDANPIPRANLAELVDPSTADVLEFSLGETTFGVSQRALDRPAESVGLSQLLVLCNPEFEPANPLPSGQQWGTDPRNWHRDIRPDHDAPLSALLVDEAANGPGYTQWNIALYDEAILYVIPGSHRRLTSEVETVRLQAEGGAQSPLDGSVCVELKAGAGVVYSSMLLHWGSKYTHRQKRRTLHFGYRSFGRYLPHQRECTLAQQVGDLLATGTLESQRLARSFELFRDEYMLIEEIFRAAIDDDAPRFDAGVQKLHPNSEGRLTCIILLSRIARNIYNLSRDHLDEVRINSGTPSEAIVLQTNLSNRFSAEQLTQLWKRFGPLDDMLRSGETTHVSGFLGPPTEYTFEELPCAMTTNSVLTAMFAAV